MRLYALIYAYMSKGFKELVDSRQISGTWRTEKILNDTSYYIQSEKIIGGLKDLFCLLDKLKIDNGNKTNPYYLQIPLWFDLEKNVFTVWAGFKTDYASIPRFWWIIIAPTQIKRAAIIHDSGYRLIWFLKKEEIITNEQFKYFRNIFDNLFHEAMGYVDPPISGFLIFSAYKSVRAFGWIKGSGLKDKKIIENNFPQWDRIE